MLRQRREKAGLVQIGDETPARRMTLRNWLAQCRAIVVKALTTGDVRSTLRNYLAAAFSCGLVIGALLAALWAAVALLVAILAGAALGYAARSYVSFRRREAFRRRHEDGWTMPPAG